jgi:intraflagellar transport protein 81
MREPDTEEKIVSLLRDHFNLNFTLYQFSETSGRDLLELLNTVLHHVSDLHPEKLGTEKIDSTVYRISEFLRILKYDFRHEPEEFDARLTQSDKDIVHPILLFLLQDLPGMQKRAYTARFSEEVPIPEEIRVDPVVHELFTQHRELREHFLQVLDEHDRLGETNVDELKKQKIGRASCRERV